MSKVLAVVTSHPVYDGHQLATGLWLSELTHFFDRLVKAGHQVDIASIAGGQVPLDPTSLQKPHMDAETKGYHDDPRFMKLLAQTPALKDVNVADYAAIYFAGGHGTMYDFPENPAVAQAILTVDAQGGLVSAVCPGPAAFIGVMQGDRPFIAGKKLTGFTVAEEWAALRRSKIPFVLEEKLKAAGADYGKTPLPYLPHVVVDGRLITGQNPMSAKGVAQKVIERLARA